MKYAHIETETNKLLGWYDDSIHEIIPTPNIKVTDEVWQEAININANCYEDEKFTVKDFRTAEEIKEQENKKQLYEAKSYLETTGWIWEKYNRNVIVLKTMTNTEFKTKYDDIIKAQEEARILINKIEES